MNTKEIAQTIVDEINSMSAPLATEDFAPVAEVENWLTATGNEGNAEAISEEIYKIISD